MENDERSGGSDVTTRLTYLLIGGGIGAILALLFAPKPGSELRGDIADVTRKGIDKTRDGARYVGGKATDYYGAVRDKAGQWIGSRGGQVSDAIEAGKQAYSEEKRRTEPGSSEGKPTYPPQGDLS